ncbi:ABC-2 type transport system permease protein [Nocardioides sp. YR527]|uniref:ABC transporter permease n=1 Tax=Nocardioides sp. YR527 TaxID=1881028 RepID=UPI000888FCB6|nr:ABC transporter permease [Nocardioides sp. YR527]SDK53358.1 ABC-2 type transport system permease protein [Nocardioides sp. YR527]
MHPSLQIAAKDLRQRARDRSAFLLAIVVPFVLAAVFSLLFGPAATPRAFDYAVVDLDGTAASRAFTVDVLGALQAQGVAEVSEVDEPEARAGVRDGDLDAAFVLPPGFAADVASPRPAELRVIGSADSPTATVVARSVARSYVEGLDAARVAVAAVRAARPALTPAEIERVAQETVHDVSPVVVEDVSATARVLDAKTYFAAAMAVFFLLFTVQFGVSSLIDERGEGTLARLLAAPIRRWEILAGKLLTSVVLGIVSLTVLLVASAAMLGARWGDPLGVGLLVVSGVLAGTGITSVIASLARTSEQAGTWQAVVAVTLGLLGGAFFPVRQAGAVIANLSLVTPHAWFLGGLGDLAGGGGAAGALPSVAVLLGIAAVTTGVALLRIGRTVAP